MRGLCRSPTCRFLLAALALRVCSIRASRESYGIASTRRAREEPTIPPCADLRPGDHGHPIQIRLGSSPVRGVAVCAGRMARHMGRLRRSNAASGHRSSFALYTPATGRYRLATASYSTSFTLFSIALLLSSVLILPAKPAAQRVL